MFIRRLILTLSLALLFVSADTVGQTPCGGKRVADNSSQPVSGIFGQSLKRYSEGKKPAAKSPENGSITSDDDETIRIRTDLVLNQVWVTDQTGNPVSGLERDEFVVTEDGDRQTIEVFSRSKDPCKPRSIVLILGNSQYHVLTFNRSVDAALKLVRRLEPSDRMAIVTTAPDITLLTPFTSDKGRLERSLEFLRRNEARAWSLEFDALLAVLNELFPSDDSQRIVIFQSEGTELVWLKEDGYLPIKFSKDARGARRYYAPSPNFGFRDIADAISRSEATVYSIIPGIRLYGLSKKEQLARGGRGGGGGGGFR